MAEPFLIIDGYNLMHALGMTRLRYGPGDLERTRTAFVNYLAGRLAPAERERTTVVFDAGDAPPDLPRQSQLHAMQIVFAPPGGDADSVIEELIAGHSSPRQILVISSDHRLQKAVRRRRGRYSDSEPFAALLEERNPRTVDSDPAAASTGPAAPTDPKFGGSVSASETDALLKIFGEIPEAGNIDPDADDVPGMLRDLPDDLDELLDDEDK